MFLYYPILLLRCRCTFELVCLFVVLLILVLENDGVEIQNFINPDTGKVRSHNYNLDYIFKKGITWNALSSGNTSMRISEYSLFDNAGSSMFLKNENDLLYCKWCYMCII